MAAHKGVVHGTSAAVALLFGTSAECTSRGSGCPGHLRGSDERSYGEPARHHRRPGPHWYRGPPYLEQGQHYEWCPTNACAGLAPVAQIGHHLQHPDQFIDFCACSDNIMSVILICPRGFRPRRAAANLESLRGPLLFA